MNDLKRKMIELYGTVDYDWMNYKIEEDDVITYHHIVKKEDGGEYTKENGALLTQRAHNHLHYIERIDKKIYDEINEVFKYINEGNRLPNEVQREKINLLLLKFEIMHADKIISKKEKVHSKRKRIILASERRFISQNGGC